MAMSGKTRKRSLVRYWVVAAVSLIATVALTVVNPDAKQLSQNSPTAGQERPPRPPLPNPRSSRARQIKRANLIERVVVDDVSPRQFQEVLVSVELKPGFDASKAIILISGKVGNPRIVRFFQPGEDRVQVFVEAGGYFDSQDVKVKVARATHLRTTALLEAQPYAFRVNAVEFNVTRAPRGTNRKFSWSFGDGESATTNVPWTTHSYPATHDLKTYQASVTFDPVDARQGSGTVVPDDAGGTPNVQPRGSDREVTLRETVVRWPRPAGISPQRRISVSPISSAQAKRRQTKLRDYAIGYEVYQAMKLLGKQQVTIEDLYRLKHEGRIRPWVPRRSADAADPSAVMLTVNYAGPQSNDELDRLAEELFGPGYEFQYVPGRLVNARKGDLYLVQRVDVPGVSAIIQAMGQVHTHIGMLAEDQYTVRDMSANGKSPHPKKAGEMFRGSESDYSDPSEKIPFRLNPILLRQQGPGIRERSVDEAIVGGSLPLDTTILVKPLPANEAVDRPRVEAVVEAARQINSSVGGPGLYTNYYKLYSFTDVHEMGMCSGYIWSASQGSLQMPVFDYSPTLRRTLAQVCYDDTKEYLFRKAWAEAGGGSVAIMLEQAGFLSIFATNAANQIVNTFGWDDSYNLSHAWADFTDEKLGWSHTVSPDNLRPRWFDIEAGADVDGWGRPWGYEVPLEYELGSYRAVKKDASETSGNNVSTTATRVKLVLQKLKCELTEESTDEVYVKITFKNIAGRTVQSFTTKVYGNVDENDEKNFNAEDQANVGWINIGEGITVEVTLWEQDGADSPDDKLGTKIFTIRPVTIPAGSAVVFGEPPGRKQDEPGSWTFARSDPSPFASDWKYRVWLQTVYAPSR